MSGLNQRFTKPPTCKKVREFESHRLRSFLLTEIIMIDLAFHHCHRIDWLDTLQKIAQIVTAGSLGLALGEYFYRRKKDKTVQVIDQISFFRKEVIPQYDEFIKLVRDKKDENYVFKRIRLDNPTINFVRETYGKESKEQVDLITELKTLPMQTKMLNVLEELALKIIHFKTSDHEALNSIKAPYIESIEINAVVLLTHRDIFSGNRAFSAVLDLYKLWSAQVDRKTPQERLDEIIG